MTGWRLSQDLSPEAQVAGGGVLTDVPWSTAWRRVARVVAFAFPHRAKELEDYAEYIENEFAAKNTSSHH